MQNVYFSFRDDANTILAVYLYYGFSNVTGLVRTLSDVRMRGKSKMVTQNRKHE